MSGPVTPYVDFYTPTADTGANGAASIQPIANGEKVAAEVQNRSPENLRVRTEVIRKVLADTLYLQNADRSLVLAGPGKITWPGSTTAGASGIPTLSDVIWLMPMLTPGAAQTQPVPPVASVYGKLHLKRASDLMNSIVVTSARRSYAAGDQINVTVTLGDAFSCTLVSETGYQRTIKIVATVSTTLGMVITALNGLTPASPDNTPLVTAALEGGALTTDVIMAAQNRQFVVGNYDAEGHAITPANVAAFFTANPTSALAEGDSLCIQFAMVTDTGSTGGRRQALPENTNTAVPSGSYFNSRVNPDKLVNALPICKVVNGALVFGTGTEIAKGVTAGLSSSDTAMQAVIRNGGFELGMTIATPNALDIPDWYIVPNAVNGTFRRGVTTPYAGAASLEHNRTSVVAASAQLEQHMAVPVVPNSTVRVTAAVRQLIAPTGGTYEFRFQWLSADGLTGSITTYVFGVNATTDSSWRLIDTTVAVPASRYTLAKFSIVVNNVTTATTGVALVMDDVQVFVGLPSNGMASGINDTNRIARLGYLTFVDTEAPDTNKVVVRCSGDGEDIDPNSTPTIPSAPVGATLSIEPSALTQDPASLAVLGQLWQIGSKLLGNATNARFPRIQMPFSATQAWTLLFEATRDTTGINFRVYAEPSGDISFVVNAQYTGTQWARDTSANAYMLTIRTGAVRLSCKPYYSSSTWATWNTVCEFTGSEDVTIANPDFAGLQSFFDSIGNRHVARDHFGVLRTQSMAEIHQTWFEPMLSAWTTVLVGTGAVGALPDTATDRLGVWLTLTVSANNDLIGKRGPAVFNAAAGFSANALYVLEFDVSASVLIGSTPHKFSAGLMYEDFDSAGPIGAQIYKDSTNGNWRFVTGGGDTSVEDVNTGVAPTAVPQRFRIEVVGANWGYASVNLYIDGVLKVQSTAFAAGIRLVVGTWFSATGAPGGTRVVYVSPMTYRMFRRASDDNI